MTDNDFAWASTAARWRINAAPRPRRKRRAGARLTPSCSRMLSAWSQRGMTARKSGCRRCSRRRSARPLQRDISFCGYAVQRAGPSYDRLADARSSPRRGRDQSRSRVILPILPTKRSVRRARAAVADQHRRRNARGAPAASAWGMNVGLGEPEFSKWHAVLTCDHRIFASATLPDPLPSSVASCFAMSAFEGKADMYRTCGHVRL
jgi:hypothetical protein